MLWISLLLGIVGVDIGIYWAMPWIKHYCGLSGVLNTLWIVALGIVWQTSRSRMVPLLGLTGVAKLAVEMNYNTAIFTDTAWPPLIEAHLAGQIAGLLILGLLTVQQFVIGKKYFWRNRMKTDLKMILSIMSVLLLNACSIRDAALLATVPAHTIGVPLGMTLTAIDETFATAKEVVDANPRYDKQPSARQAGDHPSFRLPDHAQDIHYYKTEVLIKTRGQANIQSVELIDSQDVTNFWR